MKQIWIDYCLQFGIPLTNHIPKSKRNRYIEWLEDKCKQNQKLIDELLELDEEGGNGKK